MGDLFAEKETKRRPILAKGLLRRPRSPKGDLFGNTAPPLFSPERQANQEWTTMTQEGRGRKTEMKQVRICEC